MEKHQRLVLARIQVNNLIELFKDNEYERFFISHLTPIFYEIERQLSNEQSGQKTSQHGHG